MSDTAELLLKKYYGFGTDRKNEKFLSCHEAVYHQYNFDRKSESKETTGSETIDNIADQGPISEATGDDVKKFNQTRISIGNEIIRSARAINDDDTPEEESDTHVYDDFLEPTLSYEKEISEKNHISDVKDSLTPKIETTTDSTGELLNPNNSIVENFEDVSEMSDASSVLTTNKSEKNKSSLTASTTSLQPPKKLPTCNGVFLDLSKLSLVEFPVDKLSTVPRLRMLYLENNLLTTLPDELFSSLRLLQWLDVRNNRLEALPMNIKYHPCLETVLLDGNFFQELPLELCSLPNLKGLQISRNPLKYPPADIVGLGFAATIHFLRTEWNKSHPEEIIESPKKDKKPKPSTILCSDPPILQLSLNPLRIYSSSSTGHVTKEKKKISVRQKARNYRPSNRCENHGTDQQLEKRLMWIARVKEMLIKQSHALQKIKDQDVLSGWRRDRRSYEKSMSKAAIRTEVDIPFAIDLDDFSVPVKDRLKMPLQGAKSRKQNITWMTNINQKITDICESLNRLEKTRTSEILSPRGEQRLLANEIKKLSDMYEEIQSLRRHNETTISPFDGFDCSSEIQQYKPPPSLII